jgi:ferredoxin
MQEVTITLANRGGASFRVDRRKPLLDALEAQGMSLPYGCRYGGCISCAAKLLSGEIDQRAGVALNGRQLAEATSSSALLGLLPTAHSTSASKAMTGSTATRSQAHWRRMS